MDCLLLCSLTPQQRSTGSRQALRGMRVQLFLQKRGDRAVAPLCQMIYRLPRYFFFGAAFFGSGFAPAGSTVAT